MEYKLAIKNVTSAFTFCLMIFFTAVNSVQQAEASDLPDLTVLSLDDSQVVYNQATLSVAGHLEGNIRNIGGGVVDTSFQILAFEDVDLNGTFGLGDTLLGSTVVDTVSSPLGVNASIDFNLEVNGQQSFYQAPIMLFLDSENLLIEVSETNNFATTARSCGEQSGPAIDLALCMDGSGSISNADFQLQLEGTALALENPDIVPHDGSVRLSVLQFAAIFARTEVPPTVITSLNAEAVANTVRAIDQLRGATPMHTCINTATDLILSQSPSSLLQTIDISTDGRPSNVSATEVAATRASLLGIDVLNAITVGSAADIPFMESIVFPQPAGGNRGFVESVSSFQAYVGAISNKIQKETQTVDLTVGQLSLAGQGLGGLLSASFKLGNAGSANITEDVRIRLYNGEPSAGGSLLLEQAYSGGLISGASQLIELFGINPGDINNNQLVVIVDLMNGFSECSISNNRQNIDLVFGSGKINLSFDTLQIGPNTDLPIETTIANTGLFSGNYQVTLELLDMAGNQLFSCDPRVISDLPGSEQRILTDIWNSQLTQPGSYQVLAILFDDAGVEIDRAVQSFMVLEQDFNLLIQLKAMTDKAEYFEGEQAKLSFSAENNSLITSVNGSSLVASVLDPTGLTIFEEIIPVSAFEPGQVLNYMRFLDLSQSSIGMLQFDLSLIDIQQNTLASTSTMFTLKQDIVSSLLGNVQVAFPQVVKGELQSCTYNTTNISVGDVNALLLKYQLTKLEDQSSILLQEKEYDLAENQSVDFIQSIDTSAMQVGQSFECALKVFINNEDIVLSTDRFEVIAESKPALCDANEDQHIDRLDLSIIFGSINALAEPGDLRDADQDGFITVLDGRICSQQCTLPTCATKL